MKGKVVRTLNFEKEKHDPNTIYKLDGVDENVTNYCGVTPTESYVYFLYSGPSPKQVWEDSQKGNNYIYVEKYNWNGTHITRYWLDKWGYFTVYDLN